MQKLSLFTARFLPVALENVNKKAAMLERSENKYILSLLDIEEVAPELIEQFDILEIDKKRSFSYETIYFDDSQHICYRHHRQGKRQRFKVRTRKYIESNLCFFEVKLKDLRNKTKKFRYKCREEEHGVITEKSLSFLEDAFLKIYNKKFDYTLQPSSQMSYRRITLVAKQGGERMTIDYQLTFHPYDLKNTIIVPENFIIIETKSAHGRGLADSIFKKHRHRSLSCSKFCLSKIIMENMDKKNNFHSLLKKHLLDILPPKTMIPS